ncbi:unnamed protein product [Blepharisma stoltei]|uniref:Uncharacterized protein n=1 Tax=Blepharisma stoltei TaxID=1481888 RepID=A0AAU9INP5_9CILI|nr:unnamed protein product [Blepharisma stoltei]
MFFQESKKSNAIETTPDHPIEHPQGHTYENPIENPIEHPLRRSYEISLKKPNPAIESTLSLIYEQISSITEIKNKFSNDFLKWSCCSKLLKSSLNSIEQYNHTLDQIKTAVENAQSIDDFPLSLLEIMNIADNIKIQIECIEKLNEILLLENQVKMYWLAKFSENPEKIDKLKSELSSTIEDIENWCSHLRKIKNQLKFIDDAKIYNIINALKPISELINNNFKVKHFFYIKDSQLWIYGTEAWRWSYISLPFDQYDSYSYDGKVIELPNSEIFCLTDDNDIFTFDLKTWRINKKYPDSSGYRYSLLLSYENCVYLFCFKPNSLACLEKFNISSTIKTSLPSPPIDCKSSLSGCVYKNSFLFCAKASSRLFKFDLLIESYSQLPISVNSKFVKMLFTGNMRVYIANQNYGIFESEVDNEYHWNQIGQYQIDSIEKCIDFSHLNFTYFSIVKHGLMKVYLFDLGNKKIYKTNKDYYGRVDI